MLPVETCARIAGVPIRIEQASNAACTRMVGIETVCCNALWRSSFARGQVAGPDPPRRKHGTAFTCAHAGRHYEGFIARFPRADAHLDDFGSAGRFSEALVGPKAAEKSGGCWFDWRSLVAMAAGNDRRGRLSHNENHRVARPVGQASRPVWVWLLIRLKHRDAGDSSGPGV